MSAWIARALAAMLAAAPCVAWAQAAATPPRTVSCEGPIARDADEASVIALFGRANVAFQEVSGSEGETAMATVVFPGDARNRLDISWYDERKRPATITIGGESQWTGPKGLKIGMTLADVQALNGRPFQLSGFDWDYGGYVTDWRGGALPDVGGCSVTLRFEHAVRVPASVLRPLLGDIKLMSSAAAVRAVRPAVSEIVLSFPQ